MLTTFINLPTPAVFTIYTTVVTSNNHNDFNLPPNT